MDGRKRTGNEGEDAACAFLEANGHQVLARNWRAGHLELDIVSYCGDGVHFVEVKTRRPPVQALPQDSVGAVKQQRIVRAAKAWQARAKGVPANAECHFDVVAVMIENGNRTIDYIPDAFYPIYI